MAYVVCGHAKHGLRRHVNCQTMLASCLVSCTEKASINLAAERECGGEHSLVAA